ncbi:MAG: cupredoxin family copper-binding protein [archaeon]
MNSKVLRIIGALIIASMLLSLGCIQDNKKLDGNTGSTVDINPQNNDSSVDTTPSNPSQDDEFTSILDQTIVDVEIKDFAFSPSKIIVAKGTTIAWTNKDAATHKIMVNDFLSGNLNQGTVFKYVFDDVGTYEYYCTLHPSMKGTIIVQ